MDADNLNGLDAISVSDGSLKSYRQTKTKWSCQASIWCSSTRLGQVDIDLDYRTKLGASKDLYRRLWRCQAKILL